jgi:hypothetical protein
MTTLYLLATLTWPLQIDATGQAGQAHHPAESLLQTTCEAKAGGGEGGALKML